MKIFISIFLILAIFSVHAQDLNGVELVDKYKNDGLTTSVYFRDPILALAKTYPDFDSRTNEQKHELLTDYLHHNDLYIFQTAKKNVVVKSYVLKGDPKKVRTKYYFTVDVLRADGSIEKKIDKVNVSGSFFENMAFFQSKETKRMVGKGVQIWGYYVMVEPFSGVKNDMDYLIQMDRNNSIPENYLAKEEKPVAPLFDYQECAIQSVKKREFKITVYQYDSLGNVVHEYPRIEKDDQLYLSSISKDLTGVTTFPFFSADDKKELDGDIVQVSSTLENINYYLKDIKLTMRPGTQEVDKIEAKLIIHSFSAQGESSFDELYLAEFEKTGSCTLPKTIKFFPADNVGYTRPRIVMEIKYEFN